jgi:hypothetical protein
MMKNKFNGKKAALAMTFLMSLAAIVTAQQIDLDKAKNLIGFGKVQGTITLPPNGQLSCAQVRVGLTRFVTGDPIGNQSAGPVTPTPAGTGKCSYSLNALATGWDLGVGHASSQYSLAYQVSQGAHVTIQKSQTATRDIKITAVNTAEAPR